VKKAIVLLSALFVMVYGEHDGQENMSLGRNWKDSIMVHWQSLSSIEQLLLTGLIGLAVVWVVWRIFKCGKGGCGCHCGDRCTCKL